MLLVSKVYNPELRTNNYKAKSEPLLAQAILVSYGLSTVFATFR